jgi:hypothetical protein
MMRSSEPRSSRAMDPSHAQPTPFDELDPIARPPMSLLDPGHHAFSAWLFANRDGLDSAH